MRNIVTEITCYFKDTGHYYNTVPEKRCRIFKLQAIVNTQVFLTNIVRGWVTITGLGFNLHDLYFGKQLLINVELDIQI